jgi:hypothetical protein
MSIERRAVRQVPLAIPFGRQTLERGKLRGLGLSAVVHVGLLVLVLWGQHRMIEAGLMPGLGPNKPGGGGGDGRVVVLYVQPPAAPAAPAVEAPHLQVVTTPAVQPPEEVPVQMSAEEIRSLLQAATPGNGTGAGPGSGTGSGSGSGSGTGPGTTADSGGAGGNIFPPRLDGFIVPPVDRPASVRGTTFRVRLEVSARGEVLDMTIDPPIRDRHYRDEFIDRLKRCTITPARTRDGRAVPGVLELFFTL